MLKTIICTTALFISSVSFAGNTIVDIVLNSQKAAIQEQAQNSRGLDWKIGDENLYSLDMGFIKGSMLMKVREIAADGIWMDQNLDLGFAGKQTISTLIDPNTGEIKKIIANGQEQQVPENNTEVVDVMQEKITVPAGSFDCLHAILKDKKTGDQSDAWVNPKLVPISGMLKQISPSQMGKVTLLLKSFKKM